MNTTTAPDSESIDSTEQQRATLLGLLLAKEIREETQGIISRRERDRPMALSFAQQGLWLLAQLKGVSQAYHIPIALRLSGVLDEVALKCALDRLVARHEALRTSFYTVDGEPFQRIAAEDVGFCLRRDDLRGQSDERNRLACHVRDEATASFDLEQGPLIRGRLIRVADEEHVLLLTMHHIVSDAWSLGILVREVSLLYKAFSRGEADPLPTLPIQYADYAAWQREQLSGKKLAQQSEYWQRTLSGAPSLLELPTDRRRPDQQDFSGSSVLVILDEALTAGLHALSRRHGMTLFNTVLAGWALVLSRLSNQKDVVIGVASANRGRLEIEGLIGFFVNPLALRIDLSAAPTVEQVLERVKNAALYAQENQDLPFEKVVDLVKPDRSLNRTPIFQAMLTWQNDQRGSPDLSGLRVSRIAGEELTARFDLTLDLREFEGRIVIGSLNYATALFDRETIERHVGYLCKVLSGMVADSQQVAAALPILSQAERQKLLVEWNATEVEYPREKCVHQLFEEQARLRPDAMALVCAGGQLSYGELNRRANQLAHCLRGYGVGPEVRVGVCARRSLELGMALLAVLKAGGAYVPLDPEYPPARLEYMLAQSGCRVVLSEQLFTADLPLLSTMKALPLGTELHSVFFGAYSDANVELAESGVCPGNLAYVIYTSGSTGQPVGSAVNHRSISRLIYNDFIDYGSARTMLCAASPSFDAFTFELWGALLHGGRCVLADAARGSFAELGQVVDRQGVDCAWLTSSLFNRLIIDSAESLKGLKQLLVGGEALSIEHVREGLRRLPQTQLVNGYGPTENTTFSCTYAIKQDDLSGRSTVPIGHPIGNTQAYVLDAEGDLLPGGVVGELHLGGAGLARGYLNRPELTAEKFVPSGFARTPGERLYRTGDLVRWLSDGTLEYLGRVDQQVKIRGFRIELGEIEAQLLKHPSVREAVVVAREDEPGNKRLVAYYTASAGADVEVQSLRAHLSSSLPEYMVPAAYVQLGVLPLTPNGKLDRKALPAPQGDAYARGVYEAPVGAVETTIAQIWSEVLGLERVGRHDNFFELGGHSLRAIQMLERMRRAGLQTDVHALFTTPGLAALAQVVNASGNQDRSAISVERNSIAPRQWRSL